MYRWIQKLTSGIINGQVKRLMDRWTDERTGGQLNEQIDR